LDKVGGGITAVRSLGIDGLALIQTPTDQSYNGVQQALSHMDGFRFVRGDSLGNTPLFSADPSQTLSQVPGEWILHLDGITGTPVAQEHLIQMYLDASRVGATVEKQLGSDGVVAIHADPNQTYASLDKALRTVAGYRRLEPNTVGWVATVLATDPTVQSV